MYKDNYPLPTPLPPPPPNIMKLLSYLTFMRKIIYDLTSNFMPLDVLKCLLSCLKISGLKIS